MKMIKFLGHCITALAMLAGGTVFTACQDDIDISIKTDDKLGSLAQLSGMLLDADTHKSQVTVDLYVDTYKTNVTFLMAPAPEKPLDVKIEVDGDYLAVFNEERGTNYKLFPVDNVTIDNNGSFRLAPGDTQLSGIGVTFVGDETLQADVVYAVPLKVSSQTEGVSIPEKCRYAMYFINDKRGGGGGSEGRPGQSNTYKGDGAVKLVMYMEVNDENPLNILELKLKNSGKLLFDELVIFSANINARSNGKPYVHLNDQVTELLEKSEQLIQPLRKQGVKVILSILGNHDQAGVAKLTDAGAKDYAQQLKTMIDTYKLDGVSFDDEYTKSGGGGQWIAGSSSGRQASRLLYECKKAMPDKIVTFYEMGRMTGEDIVSVTDSGVTYLPGQFLDYYVGDYGNATRPLPGMTLRGCSGLSHQLQVGWLDNMTPQAQKVRNGGYGYMMLYCLQTKNYDYALTLLNEVAIGLYNEEIAIPNYFYKQKQQYSEMPGAYYYDATPYPISEWEAKWKKTLSTSARP